MEDNEPQEFSDPETQRTDELCRQIMALVVKEENHGVALAALAGASGIVLQACLEAMGEDFSDIFFGQITAMLNQPNEEGAKRGRQTKNATKAKPTAAHRHRH